MKFQCQILLALAEVFFVLLCLPVDALAATIYWTDNRPNAIMKADGDVVSTVVELPRSAGTLALDLDAGMVYWTDSGSSRIHRAHLDGTGVETIRPPFGSSNGAVAVDAINAHVYWTQPGSPYSIGRANLDGSDTIDLVDQGFPKAGIALDPAGGKMYWTLTNGGIQRANLDGSDVEDIFIQPAGEFARPAHIALDPVDEKVYWLDSWQDIVMRMDFDGSAPETVLFSSDVRTAVSMALDIESRHIYWLDGSLDVLNRSNLDGSDVEEVLSEGLYGARNIAIDPRPIPEPASLSLALLAVGGLLLSARR